MCVVLGGIQGLRALGCALSWFSSLACFCVRDGTHPKPILPWLIYRHVEVRSYLLRINNATSISFGF